jgi:hypothetical protein
VGALTPAHAERRVARVVGDGSYRRADRFADPVSAKRGMRDTLTKFCFDVTRQCQQSLAGNTPCCPISRIHYMSLICKIPGYIVTTTYVHRR